MLVQKITTRHLFNKNAYICCWKLKPSVADALWTYLICFMTKSRWISNLRFKLFKLDQSFNIFWLCGDDAAGGKWSAQPSGNCACRSRFLRTAKNTQRCINYVASGADKCVVHDVLQMRATTLSGFCHLRNFVFSAAREKMACFALVWSAPLCITHPKLQTIMLRTLKNTYAVKSYKTLGK